MTKHSSRYDILDSFRALAALGVVCYHYFYRWSALSTSDELIPATPILTSNSVVQHGFLGVEFFFIISGFVIALTLQRTTSILEFAINRFARLFPAMLACAAITFLVVQLLGVAPFSNVAAIDFLPSLTFLSPQLLKDTLGIESSWISDVYWSLFVELKFYILAAVIYLIAPRKLVPVFFGLSVALIAAYWISVATERQSVIDFLELYFFPKYALLFAAGMAYQAIHGSERGPSIASMSPIAFSLAYTLLVYSPINPVESSSPIAMLMIVAFFLLFSLFVADSKILAGLKSGALAQIGVASYSLYLLHEGIGVPIINRLNEYVFSSGLWPFLVAVMVIALSLASYRFVEAPGRRFIRKLGPIRG